MKNEWNIVIPVMMFIAVIFLFVYAGPNFGFDTDFTNNIISLMPGVLLIVVGLGVLATLSNLKYALPICAIIGMGLALIENTLNTNGILIDEYITATLTIQDVQLYTILLLILVGGGLSVSTLRK